MNIIVTGGAGFIGSALVRFLIKQTPHCVLNIDKLTYASNLASLNVVQKNPRYQFLQADICDENQLAQAFSQFQPDAIFHLAAESHVDRSIAGAAPFIQSNIVGTYQLLETTRFYWQKLPLAQQQAFRFIHISTDEVFGDLHNCLPSDEQSAYAPSSPYSASKAASDHLVQAWQRTYGLPCIITHCSNNFGPFQHSEKLIPLIILNALQGKPLPIYGDGSQIRDWLFVEDHVRALYAILERGKIGESYNIGGQNEIRNLDLVKMICAELEDLAPNKPAGVHHYADLIRFVADRPGHDLRYALDTRKINEQLDWRPQNNFASALRATIRWYQQQI